jgi:hypothetical protein
MYSNKKQPASMVTIEILVLERVSLRWSCKHFWQKNLVKSLLISTLDKVIYYLSLQHKIGLETS